MEYTDQMGRTVILEKQPRRIISIVPSQTELLFQLGLDEEVVGITLFCIHPGHHYRTKDKIGGTKKLNFERIDALKPDLIIGNKEENEQNQVEELAKKYPVWMSDIKNLDSALEMIKMVGELTGKEKEAYGLNNRIIENFNRLETGRATTEPIKTAYLIWRNPWMGVAGDTFINEMLQQCGLQNVLEGFVPKSFTGDESLRYPMFSLEELAQLNPDVVLLSSEPFPFKAKHMAEIRQVLPSAEIRLVDGEMFSWYGSRLLHSPAYFRTLVQSLDGVRVQ